jgi:2-haloacid dehalogenase
MQHYEVYGLTNWSMETFPAAREHFGILQMIDRYVVSAAERLIKPDPRLFQVLLDRYGLRAEECTFIDDNPDNVAAARKMGMKGIVFTGADSLRKELGL